MSSHSCRTLNSHCFLVYLMATQLWHHLVLTVQVTQGCLFLSLTDSNTFAASFASNAADIQGVSLS